LWLPGCIITTKDLLPTAEGVPALAAFFKREAGTARRAGYGDRGGCCCCRDEWAYGDDQLPYGRYRHRFCVAVLLVLLQVVTADLLFVAAVAGITQILGFGRKQAGTGRRAGDRCSKSGNGNQQYKEKKADNGQEQVFFHKNTTVWGYATMINCDISVFLSMSD